MTRYQSYRRRTEVSETRSHVIQAIIDRHMNAYNAAQRYMLFRQILELNQLLRLAQETQD